MRAWSIQRYLTCEDAQAGLPYSVLPVSAFLCVIPLLDVHCVSTSLPALLRVMELCLEDNRSTSLPHSTLLRVIRLVNSLSMTNGLTTHLDRHHLHDIGLTTPGQQTCVWRTEHTQMTIPTRRRWPECRVA